jgi:hypothetical protein
MASREDKLREDFVKRNESFFLAKMTTICRIRRWSVIQVGPIEKTLNIAAYS